MPQTYCVRFSRQAVISTQDRLLISCLLCCPAHLVKVTALFHSKQKGHFCILGLLSRDKGKVSFNTRYSYSDEVWMILMIQVCVSLTIHDCVCQQIIQKRNRRRLKFTLTFSSCYIYVSLLNENIRLKKKNSE